MKKELFAFGLLLMCGLFYACGDDDEQSVKEQFPIKDGNNEQAVKKPIEVWELRRIDRGWGMITTFNANEVVCDIYANDSIMVINDSDYDLSPFVNSGTYALKFYTKDASDEFVSINGIQFQIRKEDEFLHLYHNSIDSYCADGTKYDLKIIR